MATTTIELRNLIKTSNFNLFDFDLPIDDQVWSERVKKSIIDYYFFYEIGSETPDRFKQRFQSRLELILPYYNKLYNTTLLDVNPLINYSLSETLTETGQENTSTASETGVKDVGSTSSSQNQSQSSNDNKTDYPQNTNILNDIPSERSSSTSSANQSYSGNTNNKQDATMEGSQNRTQNKTYTKKIEGLTGQSYASLIMEHRQSILKLEQMIIKELKSLFILVY